MTRVFVYTICCFLFLGAAPGVTPAQVDPLVAFSEKWRWRIFDREEGLNSNDATALYQDPRRHIHVATDRGLCRYNLHHWESIPWEPADGSSKGFDVRKIIESLHITYCVTPKALWFVEGGTRLERLYPPPEADWQVESIFVAADTVGNVHYMIDKSREPRQQFRRLSGKRLDVLSISAPPGKILDYQVDLRRVHWVATDLGLFYRPVSEARWIEVRDRDLDVELRGADCVRFFSLGEPVRPGDDAADDESLGLWGLFATTTPAAGWRLGRLRADGYWTVVPCDVDGPPIESICIDGAGNCYATSEDGRLYLRRAGTADWILVKNIGLGEVKLHGGFVDAAGDLWFRLGGGGVALVNMRSRRWQRLPGLPGRSYPRALSLLVTEAGEVWVGTDGGVIRYPARGATTPEGPPLFYESILDTRLRKITALAEDSQGNVWIASDEAFSGAFFHNGSTWVRAAITDLPVRRIVTDRKNELWFLPGARPRSDARSFVYRRSAHTQFEFRTLSLDRRVETTIVNDLARPRADTFWLATEDGLLRCELAGDEFQVRARYGEAEGLVSSRVWAVEEGPDGAIWVCYPNTGRGVTRLLDGVATTFDVQHGIASPAVWSVIAAGQDIWLGTERGLSRFDGECWYSYRIASADPQTSWVFPLAVAKRSGESPHLLVGTLVHGVWRFRRDDLRLPRFAEGEFPEHTDQAGRIAFSWRARDYKNETLPSQLLYRYRLDGGAWSPFQNGENAALEAIGPGRHAFEVEVRDLDGNRNPKEFVHSFEGPAGGGSWWMAAAVIGASGVALAVCLLLFVGWSRRRRRLYGRYRGLFAAYPAPVFVVDRAGGIIDYNGVGRELLGLGGLRGEQMLGQPLWLIPALSNPAFRGALDDLLRGQVIGCTVNAANVPDDADRVLEVNGFPLRHEADGFVVMVADRTSKVEMDRLLSRERRLDGMRDFAERIAAGLDDLLGSVRDSAVEASTVERLERAESLLRGLRGFASRTEAPKTQSLDLGELLESILGMNGADTAAAGFSGNVRLDYRMQTGLWPLRVERETLRAALREVFRNAAEAMPREGTLTVRGSNVRLETDPGPLRPGSYVELIVADDGPGIDVSQLEAIFDPFYSTKPRDRAQGVGLSLAYAAIRSQGGDIRVQSSAGRGTRVKILLPALRG